MADQPQIEEGLGHPLPIKLSRIDRFPDQPRRYFDPDTIEELADSIQSEGQRTPVSVCRTKDRPGHFTLIGGERRWRSFHLIQERTGKEPLVNAFVDFVSSYEDHFRKALADNLYREDLVPTDEAAALWKLKHENKMTLAEIAKMIGKSVGYVDNYIHMHLLSDGVKELMNPSLSKAKRLSVTSAIDIARGISGDAMQLKVATDIVDRQLGIEEARVMIGVRRGTGGFGRGGRLRRPSQDYKRFKTRIGNFRSWVQGFISEVPDLETMYINRNDPARDMENDQRLIARLIEDLKTLQEQFKDA